MVQVEFYKMLIYRTLDLHNLVPQAAPRESPFSSKLPFSETQAKSLPCCGLPRLSWPWPWPGPADVGSHAGLSLRAPARLAPGRLPLPGGSPISQF